MYDLNELTHLGFNQILNATSSGIRIIDRDFNVIQVNKAYSALSGISDELSMGRKCYETFGSPLCHTPDCPLIQILGGNQRVEYESERICSDGNEVTCVSTTNPLYSPDGELIGIIENLIDVTKYKQIEKELLIMDSAVSSSINAIAISDLDGTLSYVNNSFLNLWECNRDEVLGKSILEFWQTDEDSLELVEALCNNGSWIGERVAKKKDGTVFYVQISASVIEEEASNPFCIMTSFIDVTLFKQIKKGKMKAQTALEAVKKSTETIKSIMDAVVIAMVITDLDGNIMRINKGFTETLGWDKSIIGKHLSGFFSEKDIQGIRDSMDECLKIGYVRNLECSAMTENKDSVFVLFDLTLLMDSSGETAGMIAVMRDINERKQAEEARERLSQELISKNKELEQVVYVASHDLRSPLVNIQGFTKELERAFQQIRDVVAREEIPSELKEEFATILEEDIPEAFRYIFTSTSKMDSLLSGLLKLSRLGRQTLNMQNIDMNSLISKVAITFEFQLEQASVDLHIDDLPPCYGDESQINQVFSNLLGNAIKYLDPSRQGVIRITGEDSRHQVIYCVSDNGIGIEHEHQDRIYDLFYRLNPSSTSGEGLGLSIIRKILDRHNGHIWVESEYGVGSMFYVSLSKPE